MKRQMTARERVGEGITGGGRGFTPSYKKESGFKTLRLQKKKKQLNKTTKRQSTGLRKCGERSLLGKVVSNQKQSVPRVFPILQPAQARSLRETPLLLPVKTQSRSVSPQDFKPEWGSRLCRAKSTFSLTPTKLSNKFSPKQIDEAQRMERESKQ